MNIIKKIYGLFKKKKSNSVPLLIIKRFTDDGNMMEYNSIDEAISDLEKDPNISAYKIEKLKVTLKNLKDKDTIKIIKGEIIK